VWNCTSAPHTTRSCQTSRVFDLALREQADATDLIFEAAGRPWS
jgi:hypothetical protein